MTIRFLGLVPAIALLASGAAYAQANNATTGGGGQMAYPDSLPGGRVTIPAPRGPDTGNMAYPTSPGGVTETAPVGRGTGNMAYPSGSSGLTGTSATPPMRGMAPRTPAAAAPPPSASGMAAARGLETAPSAAPVPYTDFSAPAAPMKGGHAMMRHRPMMKHAAAKKPATPSATAAPATPAPAAK